MSELRKFTRRGDTAVTAIQLALETDGFTYRKWGGTQNAAAGDWLVENSGDVYTVEQKTFERTYRPVGAGQYVKVQPVWARQAEADGKINTKEGETNYRAGDMIVFNREDETDGYAMSPEKFQKLYEPADEAGT